MSVSHFVFISLLYGCLPLGAAPPAPLLAWRNDQQEQGLQRQPFGPFGPVEPLGPFVPFG